MAGKPNLLNHSNHEASDHLPDRCWRNHPDAEERS